MGNIAQVILGVLFVGLAYYGHNEFSAPLMVQGMIFINFGFMGWGKKRSLNFQ